MRGSGSEWLSRTLIITTFRFVCFMISDFRFVCFMICRKLWLVDREDLITRGRTPPFHFQFGDSWIILQFGRSFAESFGFFQVFNFVQVFNLGRLFFGTVIHVNRFRIQDGFGCVINQVLSLSLQLCFCGESFLWFFVKIWVLPKNFCIDSCRFVKWSGIACFKTTISSTGFFVWEFCACGGSVVDLLSSACNKGNYLIKPGIVKENYWSLTFFVQYFDFAFLRFGFAGFDLMD